MNIVSLQDDIYYTLKTWAMVENINVASQRKMRAQSMIDFATIYQTVRNGAAGIGILVEMPSFEMSPNISGPGPQTVLVVSVLVVECPPINLTPQSGTGTDAEAVSQLVLTLLHQWLIEGEGELYPDSSPISPASDVPPGCIGYRVRVKMQHSPVSILRVTQPSITIDDQFIVTLTEQTGLPDVDVYWTLDESAPCAANVAATKYTGPFQTQAGDVVRWQAWKRDRTPSAVGRATIEP